MFQRRIAFLESQYTSPYYQGLEDALKARLPRYPQHPEYMQGYNSLAFCTQWAA
ncbi:hypothetical protein [Acaryochloris sp. IP29b_bin.148]|uniref:hypothetical protein n=1 Tax=Acaryochloris sp. IP29b_bin.148 TaxID=2969218 RepID=UPI002620B02C|nr:hypothetical protein [Acaryochloris sp. IP29b_bin.148]